MKKINIHIIIPKDTEAEIISLIGKRVDYSVKYPKIRCVKNAFVTHDGIVLKNGKLVKGCAFNLIGKEDKTFYFQFWRDTIEKFVVSRWGKSIPSVELRDEQKYLLIHSKWFNYAFWINAYLPRLVQAEREGLLSTVKLLVPEEWKQIPYVMESLKAFDVDYYFIPTDHHLFVKNLLMPETRKWTASFVPEIIQTTRQRLISYIDDQIRTSEFPKKIYLTRSNRGTRCTSDEKGTIQFLEKFGYQAISFEDFSIWEQIAMMNQATHFVSVHGAGLSNLMFMNEGAKVLELINRQYAELEYTFPFWRLANATKLNYRMQLCDAESKENRKLSFGKGPREDEKSYLVNSNLIVDRKLLEENIKKMESI